MAQAKKQYTNDYHWLDHDGQQEWLEGWVCRDGTQECENFNTYGGYEAKMESIGDHWGELDEPDLVFLAALYSYIQHDLTIRHSDWLKKRVLPLGTFDGTGRQAGSWAAFVACDYEKALRKEGLLSESGWVESAIVSCDKGDTYTIFEIELLICEIV